MPTPNRALSRDVIDDVRTACQNSGRATTEAEVRRTLEPLDAQQLDAVRRLARGGLTAPLGPDALVDVVQGTPVHVASARELGGYYAMKAERDALATVAARTQGLSAPATADDEEELDEDDFDDEDLDLDEDELVDAWSDDFDDDDEDAERAAADAAAQHAGNDFSDDEAEEADEYEPIEEEEKQAPRKKKRTPPTKESREQEQILMTLFAYHRDAVRVAQELGIGLQELADRIEELGLRRRIHRLLEQTTDIDVFAPSRVTPSVESPAPVVRKRGERPERPTESEETPTAAQPSSGPAAQTDPVNAHGTRVYRRSPDQVPGRGAPPSGLAVRREYVREPRRRARPPEAAPARRIPKVEAPKAPARQPFSELQAASGKATLERLLADEKANVRALAAKLAERYEGASSSRPLNDTDLRALLKAHGLAERFEQLETANTRFLIGFHQGARTKLANALLLSADELDPWLSRIGLAEELARVRAERSRLELGRKRIQDRIAQVLTRAPYLDDLGVLPVIDREVQEELAALFARLGDAEAVRAELGMEPNPFAKLLRRYEGADWVPKA